MNATHHASFIGGVAMAKKPFGGLSAALSKLSYRQWLLIAGMVSMFLGAAVFVSLTNNASEPKPTNTEIGRAHV